MLTRILGDIAKTATAFVVFPFVLGFLITGAVIIKAWRMWQ